MTVPSQADILKREQKLKEFMKRLDEDGKPQEKHVVSVVRSAIRQTWMKSDVKLAYLYSKTIPDMNPETRTKWLVQCEICGKLFKLNEVEVDHKYTGNTKFTSVEQFDQFFTNVLMVGFDGLQILCVDDHQIKTLSESLGISFEAARIEKEVIKIMKMKASDIDKFIKDSGKTCTKNKDARRVVVRQILTENA